MLHNLAAPAAATIVSVATGLNNGDISNLKVSPNFTFFPFMQLVSDMVGGLWALSLYIAVGAWICAAIAWIAGRVIHSGPMQQYSGTVFIWCALATMILGSAMAIVFQSTLSMRRATCCGSRRHTARLHFNPRSP